MQLKILLINPPSDSVEDDRVEPPLGLMYIAAVLRKKNYGSVSILDLTGRNGEKAIQEAVSSIPFADVYGISCLSSNYVYAKEMVGFIRSLNPEALIVIGGPHPTALPTSTLHAMDVNIVVAGEGEDAFVAVVSQYIKKNISKKSKLVVNGVGRETIDQYPFPTRDLVDYSTYSRRLNKLPVVSLISSRGCAYRCIYCNSIIMGGGSKGARYRTPDNILLELSELRSSFSCYRFNDDNFTGNPKLPELLVKMRELDINFRIFARVGDLTDETCRLLKDAGCMHVSVGLESLDPDNLSIVGKGNQIGKEKNLEFTRKHDIKVRAFFIVGLPYDTGKNIEKNFRKAASLNIDEFSIYPLIPYPGTILWNKPSKFGYDIIDKNFTDYIQMGKGGKTCYSLKHKNFNLTDVEKWQRLATEILSGNGMVHMKDSKLAT